VQRLTECMNNVICDIYYIIDRTQSDDTEFILQPFRTFFNRYAFHRYTGIARASLSVFNCNFDIQIIIFNGESIYRRPLQRSRFIILHQISIQVTSYTIMRTSIGTIRSDIHFQHIVALDVIIIFGKSSRDCISRQNDNTCMIRTDAYFIFCTNHAVGLNTTEF